MSYSLVNVILYIILHLNCDILGLSILALETKIQIWYHVIDVHMAIISASVNMISASLFILSLIQHISNYSTSLSG